MEKDIELFCSVGLSAQKSKETLKNSQVTQNLKAAIAEIKRHKCIEEVNGILIYHIASRIKSQIAHQIPFLMQYVAQQKLDSVQRIDYALDYLLQHVTESINILEFEKACGIGIIVTPEEIEKEVERCLKKYECELLKKRYHFNTGLLMQDIRKSLKWADGKAIKNEIDVQLFDLLGHRNEVDCIPISKRTKNGQEITQDHQQSDKILKQNLKKNDGYISIIDAIKTKTNFHKPGENFKTEGYIITPNTQKLLKEHILTTGGRVITRFPPEPNGILHIGHAKAININFGYADAFNGMCYLRYDDTNPEKEEEQFVKGILDIVQWLGYEPYKITYSSDYFNLLYEWAICLIKKGLAYVCHQQSYEIRGFNPSLSPWRNRPIQESLDIFNDMRDGLLDEGEATLRMKTTLEEGKQDPVAYRIKFSVHHRTFDEWCIYPTYDFTHCLCDSIEHITHSLCTKEFQSRRSSYYWLCNSLNIYCPVQWEYGRLNISYTVVSKRKIASLISKKIVENWDDPRLFTLSALRRRGFPPEAINNFCAKMGITGAQSIVDPTALEAAVRDVLNVTASRCMVVFQPIKVIIRNFHYDNPITISVPDFPGTKNELSHVITIDKVVYIDASDFREIAESKYTRLTLKQSVGLKYAGIALTVVDIERDKNNCIVNLIANQEPVSEKNKPKSFIQWVSNPLLITVRTYEKLFHHRNPEDLTDVPTGFLSDINLCSKKESLAYIDTCYRSILISYSRYQFERLGYFSVDPDSKAEKVIFNRTVTLKETYCCA